MLEETNDDLETFVQAALRRQLIDAAQAKAIAERADAEGISHADAALALAAMSNGQVDALQQLLQPDDVAPGFVVTDLIGTGACGVVFRARQTKLDRDVAIKTINSAKSPDKLSLERMQREAMAIARLNHPNIIAAYDCGFHKGTFYIAMELVDGKDLASFIGDSGLDEVTAWRIIRQVAAALAHAHEHDLIHRDIKPANVLICRPPAGSDWDDSAPFAKVADFGLAFQANDSRDAQLTAAGTTLGTPAYVAPEQLQDTHVDLRADIYALGATAIHMLTGKPPFAGKKPMHAIIAKTVGDDAWRDQAAEELTDASRQLIYRMTETAPDQRIADYKELLTAIDTLLESRNESTPTTQQSLTTPTSSTVATTSSAAAQANSPDSQRASDAASAPVESRRIVLSVMVIAFLAAGVWGILAFRPAPLDCAPDATGVNWKPIRLQPLFDGFNIPLSLDRSGLWQPELGDEGGVLMAQQGASMDLPLRGQADDVYSRLRVRVHVEENAEARLFMPASGPFENVWLELRQRDGHLVYQKGDGAPQPLPGATSVVLRPPQSGEVAFQVCQFIYLKEQLTVVVNGQPLATIPCPANEAPVLRITAQQGQVQFADLDVCSLLPPTEPQ